MGVYQSFTDLIGHTPYRAYKRQYRNWACRYRSISKIPHNPDNAGNDEYRTP